MQDVFDFTKAALPWVLIALFVIFAPRIKKFIDEKK